MKFVVPNWEAAPPTEARNFGAGIAGANMNGSTPKLKGDHGTGQHHDRTQQHTETGQENSKEHGEHHGGEAPHTSSK